ncbi:hypothetical protein TNIN_396021 [Trichonephila inaurata madagascariensis]|uniref:Uncharacterized protein n=1 Tax=Trichonephila inaurata madagascariensis TaxID=2747483 RepID=A0A8X6X8A1_9ARAC|nr:hypothetical protein TNIN_396021 [Trichonephila inaurata madagascariensis]
MFVLARRHIRLNQQNRKYAQVRIFPRFAGLIELGEGLDRLNCRLAENRFRQRFLCVCAADIKMDSSMWLETGKDFILLAKTGRISHGYFEAGG